MKKETAKELKIMEIESKKTLKDDDRKERLLLSRDEIFKKIMEEAKTIEAEAITVTVSPALSS
jgi:hypothetical protein